MNVDRNPDIDLKTFVARFPIASLCVCGLVACGVDGPGPAPDRAEEPTRVMDAASDGSGASSVATGSLGDGGGGHVFPTDTGLSDAGPKCSERVLVQCDDGIGVIRCGADGRYGLCRRESCDTGAVGIYDVDAATCQVLVTMEKLIELANDADLPMPMDDRTRFLTLLLSSEGAAAQDRPFRVGGAGECSAGHGWYVEDDGIYLCGATCDGAVSVDVLIGCESIWLEPAH